jgi:hypothetical protein
MATPENQTPPWSLSDLARWLQTAPDQILQWTLTGQLAITRQGKATIVMVKADGLCTGPLPENVVIVQHPAPNHGAPSRCIGPSTV